MKNKHENPKNTGSVSPDEGGQHAPDYPYRCRNESAMEKSAELFSKIHNFT